MSYLQAHIDEATRGKGTPIKEELANKKLEPRQFTPQEEMELVTLLATFHTPRQMFKWANKRGLRLSMEEVERIKNDPSWVVMIEKMRSDWNNKIFDIALSHKRKRVEEFSNIYHELYRHKEFNEASKQLINIRHEIEGETEGKGNIYNVQMNQFLNMSDEELEKERLHCLQELKKLQTSFPNASTKRLEDSSAINKKRF